MAFSLRASLSSLPRAITPLPLLCALLLTLSCALAHCPTQCMEVAYLSGNYFKPFASALSTLTPLQAAARCAEACAARGTKYFNLNPSSKNFPDPSSTKLLHPSSTNFRIQQYECLKLVASTLALCYEEVVM